ncbi:MAG TPA: hypothetical protein VFS15_05635, partial [Kofleriaceae bacterium]|nr:hypothetical protein [Kofleriaceae bacterium]
YHEAAALWAQLGSWQAETAELIALTSSAYEDPERDAPVAYGLTARLTDLELPALRRARAIAYRLSRWSSISNTTASAGYERVVLPDDTSDPTPRGAVRQALVAAPWPDARILRPGHETRFSVQGPAHVKLEVWCRQLWSSSAGACAPSVQLDQHEPSRANAPHGEVTTLFDAAIEDGRHVLVVSLGPEAPESLAALRLVETDASEATPHRTKLFLALPGRPAEIVIAGPTTVAVDLRGIGATADEARGARAATVELIGERSESTRVELVAADVTGSTPLIVTAPVRHLVFVPAGTHRISVAPDRGKIAVRFARRIAARAITVPGRPVSLPLLATTLPWPVSLDPPLAEAASTQSMRIVPSIELVVGQDTLDEVDGEGVLRGTRVELAAQARTRLLDASWLGELRVRDTGDVQPTARLRLIGDLDRLPHGIDVRLDVGGALQMLSSANAWRLDAAAQVERAVRLTPRLQLVPDLGLRGGLLGPELPPLDADPWIASEYRRDHPIQWIARTGVWARPFADQFALARLEADSNADLVSLDQIRATLSWRALVELSPLRGPIAYVAYQPSYRFDDADRATAYVRHDMTAQLIWSFALPRGRLGFKLWADVYAPNAFIDSWERSLGIALRWDDAGAGDRIRFGFQEPLADYLDEVTWPND